VLAGWDGKLAACMADVSKFVFPLATSFSTSRSCEADVSSTFCRAGSTGSPSTVHAAPPKKRSCCCSGCLILILVILLAIGGLVGYAWFKYRPAESPVNKEFEAIPDYFPPESAIRLISRAAQ